MNEGKTLADAFGLKETARLSGEGGSTGCNGARAASSTCMGVNAALAAGVVFFFGIWLFLMETITSLGATVFCY